MYTIAHELLTLQQMYIIACVTHVYSMLMTQLKLI